MLMEASNYCLHFSGQDINQTLVKIAKVNGWLYMPSLVMLCPQLGTAGVVATAEPLTVREPPSTLTVAAAATPAPPIVASDPITPVTKERTATWTTPPLFPDS